MYKIVYWINNDIPQHLPAKEDILVIGTGSRDLTWQELTLTEEQISKIDSNTQFIFNSHGANGQGDQCTYAIKTPEGELKDYDLVSVVSEIFKSCIATQGVSLHMASCHVGAGYAALASEARQQVQNANWLGNAIFLHGGSDTIREYRTHKVLNMINDTIFDSGNAAQNSFNLFEQFYIKTPGDMYLIQAPGLPQNKPLFLTTKFVGHDLRNILSNNSQQLHECFEAISDFSKQNNIEIPIKKTVNIDPFTYLKECLLGGADAFYGLEFPMCVGALDGTLATVDHTNVNRFVEDLYSLVEDQKITVEDQKITKEQYDELIAIQFVCRAVRLQISSITFPEGFGFKLSTAHEKLFQKGIDLTKVRVQGNNLLFTITQNYPPEIVNLILNLESVSCSDLSVEVRDDDSLLIFSLLTLNNAEALLPLILAKTTVPIDLKNKIHNSEGSILLDFFQHSNAFKANIKLLLEKSLPLTEEDFSTYIAPYIDSNSTENIIIQPEEVSLIEVPLENTD